MEPLFQANYASSLIYMVTAVMKNNVSSYQWVLFEVQQSSVVDLMRFGNCAYKQWIERQNFIWLNFIAFLSFHLFYHLQISTAQISIST